jgi:LacI family transcriptional regulator
MFLRGVVEYAEHHGGWSLTVSPPSLSWAGERGLTLASLKSWPGDGVIAAIASPAEIRAARRLGKPVVNIAAATHDCGFPRVMPDHYGMGQLTAEHLLERGLRRLAYYGFKGLWFSEQRRQGFVDRALQAGVTCDVLEVAGSFDLPQSWQQQIAPLTRFLKKLRPPIGLLAVQDYRARIVVDECQRLGLRIPHDVAVVGIDDDPTICEFCRPTLTSVSRNSWRLGYETAALLDRLMDGRPVADSDILVPSDGIVARQSTDTIAVDDPQVAAAVHFIHDHRGEAFGVDRVAAATTVSRRLLEIRFRRVVGSTMYDYICRERIEMAKNLLTRPDRVKLHKVAALCGFSGLEQMRMVFKRMTGLTPLQYRQAELAKAK